MGRNYRIHPADPDDDLASEIAEELGDIVVADEQEAGEWLEPTEVAEVSPGEETAEAEPSQETAPDEEELTLEDLLERIEQTELEVRDREVKLNLAKQEVKIRKGALDDAVLRLRELCRAREHDAARPLLNGEGAKAKTQPPQEEAWRAVGVDTLDIPNSTIKKLAEADITTMGQLADYSAAGNQLIDIAGIGPAKAEQLEDACLAFWRDNQVDHAATS